MVVRHCYEQQRKPEDAAERGGRKRPLIDRYSENLERCDANGYVGQGEQDFHQGPPIPTLASTSARRCFIASNTATTSADDRTWMQHWSSMQADGERRRNTCACD